MAIALWVVQSLLALVLFGAGLGKIAMPDEKLHHSYEWTKDVPRSRVRAIGAVEWLGALGLILPGVTHIVPTLTVAAAVGLVVLMISAATLHYRRHERPQMTVTAVLCLLAIFVVFGRFALAPLS